ncbi:MAG: TAXI family TRAP transporter solute-binding subunit [Halieaceae bacterium]|nr:TAXI family TRAP transporter solute-binding subunit [Halieaceae bacterium]
MTRVARHTTVHLLLLLLACLAGCDRGPTTEKLERHLQERLDSHFQQDLFAVEKFRRTGSAPFRDLEKKTSGVFVYYDAELELLKDYSLAEWRGLNLGTLAYAIGATESGIDGFRAQGNTAGDVLKVHGRFAYMENGTGEWTSLDKQAGTAPSKPEPATDSNGPSPESILRDARALLANAQEYKQDSTASVIAEELGVAIDQIDLRTARLRGETTLGSGPVTGTYFAFGEALSLYAKQRDTAVFSATSEGSVENASRLQAGRLDFGLVQSDVATLLHRGLVSAGLYPYRELRAVASLWPEAVQLLTLEASGISSLEDLRARRVAIGQRGSGSRINALLIGMVVGLDKDQLPDIREISLARGIAQLERGEVDALFLTEAIPARSIQALASRRDDLRYISMPPQLLDKLAERHFEYYPLTVPAKTYPGQTEPFSTIGLTAALMTHSNVPDERVVQMLELLLSGGDELARRYYRAAFISRETMQLGLAVPLHPAAQRFYDRFDRLQDDDHDADNSTGDGTRGMHPAEPATYN